MEPSTQPEHGNPKPLDLRDAALTLLEFHLVRQQLARHTSYPPATELAHNLSPSYNAGEVSRIQDETLEAAVFWMVAQYWTCLKPKTYVMPLVAAPWAARSRARSCGTFTTP